MNARTLQSARNARNAVEFVLTALGIISVSVLRVARVFVSSQNLHAPWSPVSFRLDFFGCGNFPLEIISLLVVQPFMDVLVSLVWLYFLASRLFFSTYFSK